MNRLVIIHHDPPCRFNSGERSKLRIRYLVKLFVWPVSVYDRGYKTCPRTYNAYICPVHTFFCPVCPSSALCCSPYLALVTRCCVSQSLRHVMQPGQPISDPELPMLVQAPETVAWHTRSGVCTLVRGEWMEMLDPQVQVEYLQDARQASNE